MTKDEFYMGKALEEAKTAYAGPTICGKACPVPPPMQNCWLSKKPAAPSAGGAYRAVRSMSPVSPVPCAPEPSSTAVWTG